MWAQNPSGTSWLAPSGQAGDALAAAPRDPFQIGANLDYSQNPMYLLSHAGNIKARGDASSLWLEQLKQLLLGYGSKSLASAMINPAAQQAGTYLGGAPDESAWLNSFGDSENPDTSFSTLAQLAHQAGITRKNTLEDYNKQNLYYSGAYGKAQGQDAYADQLAHANALKSIQEKMTSLGSDYLGSINSSIAADNQAANDAYQAELQRAIANGAGTVPYAPGGAVGAAGGSPVPGVDPGGTNRPATPAPKGDITAGMAAYLSGGQTGTGAPAAPNRDITSGIASYLSGGRTGKVAAPVKPKALGTPTIPLVSLTAKKLLASGLRAR